MIIKKFLLAATTGLCALALAGCQTSTDWGKVASGVALVTAGSGVTAKIDPKVAQVSTKLGAYCPALQVAASFASVALPESQKAAALMAAAAFQEVCSNLPSDVPSAVIVAEKAYQAARAARIPTAPS